MPELQDLDADQYAEARRTPPKEAAQATEEAIEEKETRSEAEEATTEADSEAAETESEEPPKSKGKGGFQKRIDKLTRKIYELENQLEEANSKRETKAAPTTAAQPAGKPKSEDFQTVEEYLEALSDWKTDQKLAQAKAQEAQEREQQRLKETFDSYNHKVAEAHAKYDDFDEVVGREDLRIPQAVQLSIIELDNGPDVAYYLGQHPEVCDELVDMSPLRAVSRVGVIAASLESPEKESSPRQRPKSAAPEPIHPVSGSAKSSRPLAEVDDADEYAARRRREIAEARRR